MTAADKTYHHGDLAKALLDATDRIASEEGLEHLSIRAVAKSVGVTHAAAFRHFASKRDLLTAFAARSARKMAAFLEQETEQAQPEERFRQLGLAYISYATKYPSQFRIIFREEILDTQNSDYLAAMDRLAAHLSGQGNEDAGSSAIPTTALLAWASVHGLATLFIDGALQRDLPKGGETVAFNDALRILGTAL